MQCVLIIDLTLFLLFYFYVFHPVAFFTASLPEVVPGTIPLERESHFNIVTNVRAVQYFVLTTWYHTYLGTTNFVLFDNWQLGWQPQTDNNKQNDAFGRIKRK